MPRSIYDLFRAHAELRGDRLAALERRDGAFVPRTWAELYARVRAISRGLVSLGVEPGDRVCIVAETSLEWVLVDLAILGVGAVTVPVYPSDVAAGCGYIAASSGAVLAIAGDAAQADKLVSQRARLPNLRYVVQLGGAPAVADGWVVPYDELERRTSGSAVNLQARREGVGRDAVATILYTAGTTGRPKGVVLTHDALLYEAEAIVETGLVRMTDVQLLYLPLAHSLGKVLVIAWLATGHVLAFADSPQRLAQNLLEVRPTMLVGVPRFYEKIYAAIVQRAQTADGVTRRLVGLALALSERKGEAEARGRSLDLLSSLELMALRRLAFERVGAGLREALGGAMRLMVSGGAPLSPKINWFLRDAGLTVLEGYGLAETSGASTVNRPGAWRIGSVGLPLAGTHVRIAADGEVLVRGRGVMRSYWQDPEATREVLDEEGWLRTGDLGYLDENGFLFITGRKKDILVTAGGKNVAPQKIENLFQSHPLIAHAVVHGDRRKYLSLLLTLDPGAVRALAGELGLGNRSYAELTQTHEVRRLVRDIVADFNRQLPSFETVKRFKILEHDLSIEAGELTSSLKVRRKVVYDRYQALFDALYDEHT